MADTPIINSTINTVVTGTSGNDTILSTELIEWNDQGTTGLIYGNITLDGAAGNDLILNSSYATSVNGGDGDDTIRNYGWETTLNGGAGNDVIQSNNKKFNLAHTQLIGGAGNDYLSVTGGTSGGFATVNGGTGTDTIDVTGSVRTMIQYAAGDGNDVVYGYYDADSVKITSGTVSDVKVSGNDVIINVASGSTTGSLTLKDAAGKVLTLINPNGSFSRKQYNADDTISARSYGSTGDDVIVNTYDNIEIDGGAGNDYIVESKTVRYIGNTWNVTGNSMKGGRGDDTMVTSFSTHFKYTEGDGNDVIVGYHNYNTYDSVVEIVATSDPEFYKQGNDYVLKIGDGSITFKDALQDNNANYILVRRRTTANGPYEELRYTPGSAIIEPVAITTVNGAANAQIDGSEEGDYITNNGAGAKIYAGDGDDSVINNAANAYVDGGAGADVILNNGANASVDGGAGDDLINNQGNNSTINAGAGADYIYSGSPDDTAGKGSVINAGAGDDILEIYSPETTVNAGNGSDYITNNGAKNVIDGGADNDAIFNNGEGATVYGGAGNDIIENHADDVYIDGGAGNDTILNVAAVDDDSVRVTTGLVDPKNVTIAGGAGDDSIKLGDSEQANVIVYNVGDGNDTIVNFKADDVVQLGSGITVGAQSAINNGADLEVIVGSSSGSRSIVFEGLGSKSFTFENGKLFITPPQEGDPDYVLETLNSEDGQYIQLENDQDWPINYKAAIYGENVTVNGGNGNDTIEGSDEYGTTYDFDAMGGNDVITNFGSKDTLRITFGDITETVVSGNDLILTVALYEGAGEDETGTITLKDGAPLRNYLVWGGDGNNELTVDKVVTTKNSAANTLISGQTATGSRDYIINTGNNVTINSGGGNDTITGSTTYGEVYQFNQLSGDNVITNFGKNDTLQVNSGTVTQTVDGNDRIFTITQGSNTATVTLKNGASKEFVENVVSNGTNFVTDLVNEVNNTKSGVKVTGTNGREYIVNTGANVTIEAKGGNDTITGSDFGEMYNFSSGEGDNVITNFGDNDTIRMTAGKKMTWAEDGDDMIVTLKGTAFTGTVTLKDAAGKTLVKNGNYLTVKTIDTINNSDDNVQVAGTEFDDLIVNSGDNVSIKPGVGKDTIVGSDSYGEVILASSADGDKNIITNFGSNDSLKMIAGKTLSTSVSGNDVIVSFKGKSFSSTYTLKNAADMTFSYDSKTSVLSARGGEGNYIYQYEDGKKIEGTGGDDFIVNIGANVTVQAGTGNDTVQGSAFGELFQFSSAEGDNVIRGFGENDTLQMTAGKTMTWATVDDDVIVTLKGSAFTGTVKLEDAAGLNLTSVKKSGVWHLVVDDVPSELVNTENDKKFNGSENAEVLLNYGNNVTVNGAGGNDTISGSDAYGEVFAFTAADGSDIITNFGDNDTIKMTSGSIASWAVDGDNVVVNTKNGSTTGTITLQNVSDKTFKKLDDRTLIVQTDSALAPNSEDGIVFNGTPNDDYMINYGQEVTIDGGEGNDTVQGSDEYAEVYTFDALGGDDVITNFGKNDLLKITYGQLTSFTKSGSDYIATVVDEDGNTGTITLKDTGAYNFHIRNNEISAETGQTIINRNAGVLVEGTDFDDRIINTGNNATINGRGGNDTITGSTTYGEVFRFGSDGGRDVITNFGANDSLQIISGAIETAVSGDEDVVVTAKGNLYTGVVTLKGANGYVFETVNNDDGTFLTVYQTDYIVNRDADVKVSGTTGDDYIINSGAHASIEAKTGNDTIEGSNMGEVFLLSSAEGNNLITNFGANDTLQMTAGKTMTWATVGDDVVVTLKGTSFTGVETLQGAAGLALRRVKSGGLYNLVANGHNSMLNTEDKKKFNGTKNADYIVNTGENVTIDANQGNDTIYGSDAYGEMFYVSSGYGENVILNFADNDSLYMVSGKTMTGEVVGDDYVLTLKGNVATGHVTLKGAGDLNFSQNGKYLTVDKVNNIDNYDDQTRVAGTTGNDYITNTGEKVTIQSNAGNDTIDGSVFGELFQFSSADGNNVITNFGANDTLQMTAGRTLSFETVGADVVVTLKGNAFTGYETLQGAAGLNFVKSKDGKLLTVEAPTPIVNTQNNVKVTGTDKDDIIISTGDNVTIEGKTGNDTITGSDSYAETFAFSSADGNNVITNFGINDTLKMTAGQTISTQTSGDDVIVTLKGKSYTGTVTLEGVAGNVFQINNSAKTLRMRAPSGSSAEMPADEDGYWFLNDETTPETFGEVDAMMGEVESDNALGKLNLDSDPNELLTSVGGTRVEQLMAQASRRHFKK